MKKTLFFILIFIIIYIGIPIVIAFANDNVSLNNSSIKIDECVEDDSGQINIPGGFGINGALIRIPVRMNYAPNSVSSFGFEIMFDPEMLAYKSFEKGSLVEDFDYFNANLVESNIIRCGGAKNNGILRASSGSILFLEFEVKKAEPVTQIKIQSLTDDIKNWTSSGGCFQVGCNGDINDDGEITPMDALNSFEKYLSICPTSSNLECENICGDVNKDGETTPADTLCIFQNYLGLPNCLDHGEAGPEAIATATHSMGKCPLTVWFSAKYDENFDDSRLKYEWDFQGDGLFDANGVEAKFTYFQQGIYTVILQVIDQDGLIDRDEITIIVEPEDDKEKKMLTIIAHPPEGPSPLSVSFYAEDHSFPVWDDNYWDDNYWDDNYSDMSDFDYWKESNLSISKIEVKYNWDFNDDGIFDARGRNTSWIFDEEGEHIVKVEAIYENGSKASGEMIVYVYEKETNTLEDLYIIAHPNIGPAPLKTKLFVTGINAENFLKESIIEWDINSDGKTDAQGIEIFHTFKEEGEYEVIANIIHQDGDSLTLTADKKIVVLPDNNEDFPEIKLLAYPDHGSAPLEVRFSLSIDKLYNLKHEEYRIQWDFESDGKIDANGPFVSHVYKTEGEYIASCQITDINGNVFTDESIITVRDEDIVISEIPDQIGYENEPLEAIKIELQTINNNALQIIANSSNQILISDTNMKLTNKGDYWILNINPTKNTYGWATITINVSDGKSILESITFDVLIESEYDFDYDSYIAIP